MQGQQGIDITANAVTQVTTTTTKTEVGGTAIGAGCIAVRGAVLGAEKADYTSTNLDFSKISYGP
jgi:hypothetical protein